MNKALFGFKQNPSYSLRFFSFIPGVALSERNSPRFLLYCFLWGDQVNECQLTTQVKELAALIALLGLFSFHCSRSIFGIIAIYIVDTPA